MSENTPPDFEAMKKAMAAELSKHWKMFLIQGIVMGILGALAIALPQIATLAIEILIGWLFFVGGIVRGFTLFSTKGLPGSLWSILTAILAVVVGLILILDPLKGTLTLTMVLIALFIVQGIISIMLALQFREHLNSWIWTLLSGVVDLVLAYLIWKGWPDSASWAIGLLVGINMLFAGLSLVFTALAARNQGPT